MHMKDFHRKFTSKNEPGSLFQALRKLSLVDDIKNSIFLLEWVPWPPSGVDAPCEA